MKKYGYVPLIDYGNLPSIEEKQIARVRKMSKEKQREFVNKQVEKSFKNDKYVQTSEVKSAFIGWWEKLGLWK